MRLLGALALLTPLAAAVWPIPKSYTSGNTTLWIDSNVNVAYSGPSNVSVSTVYGSGSNSSSSSSTAAVIQAAISRTYTTLHDQQFVPWKFHPRNSVYEPSTGGKTMIKNITLVQNGTDPDNLYSSLDLDESYSLEVTSSGIVTVTASTSIGIVRGLTTFTQLFFKHSQGGVYTNLAPVSIQDAPKFVHRGFNMDVARSWFEVSDIKRMIDAAAYNKFNRFHLHATDAQSWPLEVPALPDLAAKGAYRKDLTYSPDDIKDIQNYGALLGVQVYIEIDMPGHTSSIWFSEPDLIASFNIQPDWDTYAAEPPSGTLKLNSTKVSDFLEKLLDDVLPRVSPYSGYFHAGGDEVNVQAYLNDDTVKSNDTAILQPLMQKFVDRNLDQVRAKGLTPIVWEEMLLTWNLTLGDDVVIQTWQSDDAVAQTVAKGHKALVGNYNYWYLDCGQGQWLDFAPGLASQEYYPYADYCSPRHNWRVMYAYDPLEGVPENSTDLVLGGEAHIWTEQTDPINLDRMVWPRAAAAAEVLWSGAKDASGQNRSQVEASPRLADMRERLVARGVMAEPVRMPFCSMNGTQCWLDH